MRQITRFARHNAIALTALFVALGGTSYAAVTLPRNSVGSAQIKTNAVTSSELRKGAVKNSELGSGAVTGSKIKGNSITSSKIAAGSLLATDFKAGEMPKAPTTLPPNGAAGGALSGSYPNPGLADGSVTTSKLATTPGARVQITGAANAVSIANATNTPVPFAQTNTSPEAFDNGDLFDAARTTPQGFPAGNAVLRIPTTGTYAVSGGVRWDTNATGYRDLFLHGGAQANVIASSTTSGVAGTQTKQSASTVQRFTEGTLVFMSVTQNATDNANAATALNITPSQNSTYLSAQFVSP